MTSPAKDITEMPRYTLLFLTIALVSAVLAFTGLLSDAAGIARMCFTVFLLLFLGSLLANSVRRI
jgi:uncharacterized membrane protein YtjA (UPF0391 family)